MQQLVVLTLYYHLLVLVLKKIDQYTIEEGACFNWTGASDHGSPVLGMPLRRLGRGSRLPNPPGQIRVRALMLELFTDKRPAKKAKTERTIVVTPSCRNSECVCPDCAVYQNRGIPQRLGLANMDAATSLLRGKKISASRMHLRVLTPEQVQRIRTETSTSVRELARQMNVNFSVVQGCRAERTYRNYTANPFTGLGL